MTIAQKPILRYKPPRSSTKGDATTFPMHSRSRKPSPVDEVKEGVPSKPTFRWVRVEDSLFKVPENFFRQIPPETLEFIRSPSGRGSTPEVPIRLKGHSSDQFRQILNAFNAYPSLDPDTLTLDHILTIGELSFRYCLVDLASWFLPVFHDLVMSRTTPLRTSSNRIYARTIKLALMYQTIDLLVSTKTKWVTRMHWRQLDPLSVILFADVHGMRDLLGHACYVYLMSVDHLIRESHEFDKKSLLSPRQKTYIMSGYYSLLAYWKHLRRNPPGIAPAPQCTDHSKCVGVWKLRWVAAMEKKCPSAEVDVFGRLSFVEQCLREDTLLSVRLNPGCMAWALKAVSAKRNSVSRQLHHHFDL